MSTKILLSKHQGSLYKGLPVIGSGNTELFTEDVLGINTAHNAAVLVTGLLNRLGLTLDHY